MLADHKLDLETHDSVPNDATVANLPFRATFVVCASNLPQLVDPMLRTANRLGLQLFVGPPDRAARTEIARRLMAGDLAIGYNII
eukprot:SAG31_NODE_653_length_13152_cov_4.899487_12_plen_85_part_00